MSAFVKNFINWFSLKPNLHKNKSRRLFNEREIWWCHLGANIGYEIDGRSLQYTRPVLIIKKISHETCLVLPLTSKLKDGSWYIPLRIAGKQARLILSQSRTIDAKRLKTRLETLNENEFKKVKQKFIQFLS